MAEYEVFPNPPITEAIIDIKTILPENRSLADLEMLYEKVKDHFPEKTAKGFFNGKMKFPDKENPDFDPVYSESGIIGYLFKSEDGSKVVQFRMNGFTFNKLRPYQNWDIFSEQGRELWNLYLEASKPSQINQVGLRYINHIKLPLPFNDFNEYILTNPKIAPGLPQGIFNFFIRLEIPNPEIRCNAVIIQTIESSYQKDTLPLIFDIDVFKEEDYTDNPEKIWEDLKELKKFENNIFFKSITGKTKELFK